ncbi:MAG: hypothetical protein OSB28_03160 [Flavobacteriales bacterium]|nr:hypothetical protein [Flavobacteriales bacterium]
MKKISYFSLLLLITSCFFLIAGISFFIVSNKSNEIEKVLSTNSNRKELPLLSGHTPMKIGMLLKLMQL